MRSTSSDASASRYASASAPSGTVRTSSWRASMSESSRPSGPSNSAIWTCVARLGPAAFAEPDGRLERDHRHAGHQFASSARRSSSPGLGVARRVLVADQLHGPRASSRPPRARRAEISAWSRRRSSARRRSRAARPPRARPTRRRRSPSDQATRGHDARCRPCRRRGAVRRGAASGSVTPVRAQRSRRRPGRAAGRRRASSRRARCVARCVQVASVRSLPRATPAPAGASGTGGP